MKTTIDHVAKSIQSGSTDEEVDAVIQKHIDDYRPDTTVAQWRLDNYAYLRRCAYPPFEEFIDAQVKIAQGGSMQIEGEAQLADYYANCWAVKQRFPKAT